MFRHASLVVCLAALVGFVFSARAEDTKKNLDYGVVKSVDASGGALVLEAGKGRGGKESPERTYKFGKDVKVDVDGEAKAIADVGVGALVVVNLTDDKATATSISVKTKKKGNK